MNIRGRGTLDHDHDHVECVLCVLALWTPEVNQTMVFVAEEAGLPHCILVSEPEAAAALMKHEH